MRWSVRSAKAFEKLEAFWFFMIFNITSVREDTQSVGKDDNNYSQQ